MPPRRPSSARRRAVRRTLPLLAVLVAGCRISAEREVDVYSTRMPDDAEPVIAAFVRTSGLPVRAAYASDAYEEGARHRDSTGTFQAAVPPDVTWSDDPAQLLDLAARGLVPDAQRLAAQPEPGSSWRVVGERVQVLYVRRGATDDTPLPTSVRDLGRREWAGQVAIADPRSGPTAVHLGVLSQVWGDGQVRALLAGLRSNDVRIVDSDRRVRDLVASGTVAVGLGSYDPADGPLPPGVVAVVPDSADVGVLVVPTVAVLHATGRNPEGGRRFLEFLGAARARHAGTLAGGMPGASAHRSTVALRDAAMASRRLGPWLDGWVRGSPATAGAVLLGARD